MEQHPLEIECAKYISDNDLLLRNKPVLVGVSGGKDSMALVHILKTLGYSLVVAHCNFQLRGAASEADAQLVREWCETNDVKSTFVRFETEKHAAQEKISIEMAARQLRYQWFEDERLSSGAQFIAIAHHLNDHIETFLLNIVRGTGISGLKGILPLNGNVVRPLLFSTRETIDTYVEDCGIPFRDDHTNADINITRNYIRHEIVPRFQMLNPSFLNTMKHNLARFGNVVFYMAKQFERMERELLSHCDTGVFIGFPKGEDMLVFSDFLHHFFSKNNFTVNATEVAGLADSQVGRQICFDNHVVVREREGLSITETIEKNQEPVQVINVPCEIQFGFSSFIFSIREHFDVNSVSRDANIVWLDADKVQMPMLLRVWEAGDTMVPYGMKGKRKIKKILTDSKVPSVFRASYPVLCDEENVVWLPGIRPNNHYAVSEFTQQVLIVEYRSNMP